MIPAMRTIYSDQGLTATLRVIMCGADNSLVDNTRNLRKGGFYRSYRGYVEYCQNYSGFAIAKSGLKPPLPYGLRCMSLARRNTGVAVSPELRGVDKTLQDGRLRDPPRCERTAGSVNRVFSCRDLWRVIYSIGPVWMFIMVVAIN